MSTISKKLTFEFCKAGLIFAGTIQSVDWKSGYARVDIPDDGSFAWKEAFESDPTDIEVEIKNLVNSTERVSSHSANQLESMIKEAYP